MTIRTRDDGILEGVRGPVYPCRHDRKSIAQRMGWEDSGQASEVITKALALLAEGKAVQLTSHYGYCIFQPLLDNEDGTKIPASANVIYNPDGLVLRRRLEN